MSETGLRARKKAATRRHIADVAALLFAEHGYERVAVTDVARTAEVSEQTVYNYFPTKQDLVLDRADELADRFSRLVADRPPGTSPAAALRDTARDEVRRQREAPADRSRGDLPALSAASPTIRRLALDARDRQADAVAEAIVATAPGTDPMVAKAHAAALLSVFQGIVDRTGQRLLEGADPSTIADELAPSVEAVIDDLDRRLSSPTDPAG